HHHRHYLHSPVPTRNGGARAVYLPQRPGTQQPGTLLPRPSTTSPIRPLRSCSLLRDSSSTYSYIHTYLHTPPDRASSATLRPPPADRHDHGLLKRPWFVSRRSWRSRQSTSLSTTPATRCLA